MSMKKSGIKAGSATYLSHTLEVFGAAGRPSGAVRHFFPNRRQRGFLGGGDS